jgi:hypothetical protein
MYFQFIAIDKEGIEPDYAFPSWLGQISPFLKGRKIHTGFLKKSSSSERSVTKFITIASWNLLQKLASGAGLSNKKAQA